MFKSEHQKKIFLEIYGGLRRAGPGSFASTKQAYAAILPKPDAPRILDIGAGPGRQSFDLIELASPALLVAVDLLSHFTRRLQKQAKANNITDKLLVMKADMSELPFADEQFDIIWSEGAAYHMGFDQALEKWQPLLKEKGALAISEAVWLTDDIPQAAKAVWEEEYPAMRNITENLVQIDKAGLECIDHFTLPEADWKEEYYHPMRRYLDENRDRYENDPTAMQIVQSAYEEIEMYENYSSVYGYEFFIMRKR